MYNATPAYHNRVKSFNTNWSLLTRVDVRDLVSSSNTMHRCLGLLLLGTVLFLTVEVA